MLMSECLHVCMYVCVSVCMYVCVHLGVIASISCGISIHLQPRPPLFRRNLLKSVTTTLYRTNLGICESTLYALTNLAWKAAKTCNLMVRDSTQRHTHTHTHDSGVHTRDGHRAITTRTRHTLLNTSHGHPCLSI